MISRLRVIAVKKTGKYFHMFFLVFTATQDVTVVDFDVA